MADELASVEASPQHPSLTAARGSAADLRHRISLHTVTLAPRPLVLPGVAPLPSAGHPVNALPELWHRHRHDPVRRPSHQDAVGHPGPDGAPLDGEGGRLTDGFRTHWVDVPLAAAADPATPLSEIDALTDHSVAVLRRYGAGAAEIAGLRARVLLATGRLEQARELMELVGEAPCGVEELAVVGGTVALLRGDLDTLLRVLCHGEDTGLAAGTGSSVQWTLLTAASLVPLGLVDHVADLADLADALVTTGACHEACTVAAAGLAAVGGNWVDTGVASGCAPGEAGADDAGPVHLLRARSAALSSLGNTAGADRCAEAAATAAEYRGRWRLAEACRVDAAARRA